MHMLQGSRQDAILDSGLQRKARITDISSAAQMREARIAARTVAYSAGPLTTPREV